MKIAVQTFYMLLEVEKFNLLKHAFCNVDLVL